MPEDHDPALDPAPERADRLFPPGTDAGSGGSHPQPVGDDGAHDDPLFPPVAGAGGTGGEHTDAGSDAPGEPGPSGSEPSDDPSGGAAASTSSDGASGGAGAWTSSSDASTPGRPPHRRAKGANSFLRELPLLLLVAFVLAFVLRTFMVQVFYIPSGSMEPTLMVNDRMIVEKITYRFREPDRGEVAVFEGESFGELDPDVTAGERFVRGVGQFLGLVPASARDFVKRIVGLPGDEILIEAGTVFINGDPLDEPYVVFEDPSDFGPVTVPDGQLFFLGDNRPNSSDSRRSLGYVPIEKVVGRAAFVIWPPDNAASLMGTEYLDEVDAP